MKRQNLFKAAICSFILAVIAIILFSGCRDDTAVWKRIAELEKKQVATEAALDSVVFKAELRREINTVWLGIDGLDEEIIDIETRQAAIMNRLAKLEVDTGGIILIWNENKFDPRRPVYGYRIYLGNHLIWAGQDTSVTLENLRYSAYNSAGESFGLEKVRIK